MRWLLIVLLISVGALLIVAGAVVRHILRQRNARPEEAPGRDGIETLDGLEKPAMGSDEPGGPQGDR